MRDLLNSALESESSSKMPYLHDAVANVNNKNNNSQAFQDGVDGDLSSCYLGLSPSSAVDPSLAAMVAEEEREFGWRRRADLVS